MILITGATGFIGSALVERLIESGKKIRCLVRNKEIPGVENWKGDLRDKQSLKGIGKDIDIAIHLAAHAELNNLSEQSYKEHYKTNVIGLKNLISECRNVKKFIYISTTAVLGHAIDKRNIMYETGKKPKNPYGKTKLIGENIVKESGLNYSIIRPGLVYDNEKGFEDIIKQIKRGFVLVIENGNYLVNIIKRKELVDLIIKETEINENRTIFAISETIPFRTLVDRLALRMNKNHIWIIKIPFILFSPVFLSMDLFFRLIRKKPPISFERAYYLYKQDRFETKRGY